MLSVSFCQPRRLLFPLSWEIFLVLCLVLGVKEGGGRT